MSLCDEISPPSLPTRHCDTIHSFSITFIDITHLSKIYDTIIHDEHVIGRLSSGGFAGMLGWVAAMPFDVPKTNVQASWDSRVVGSYFPELFRIARERGPLALYTGLIPTIARAFPANAALFLGVEMGKKFFDGFVWAK